MIKNKKIDLFNLLRRGSLYRILIFLIFFLQYFGVNGQADLNDDLDKAILSKDVNKMEESLKSGANPNKGCYAQEWINATFHDITSHAPDANKAKQDKLLTDGFEVLFAYGMNLNSCYSGLLAVPIISGYKNTLEILVDHGASLSSFDGYTPMEWAEIKEDKDIINFLKKKGLPESNPNEINQIRFLEATKENDIKKMELCLERGAILNAPTKYGLYPIFELLPMLPMDPDLSELKFLVNHGVDLNIKREGGKTPLHWFIIISSGFSKKDPKYVKNILNFLLNNGAFVTIKDQSGMTPLHTAAKENNVIAAEILIKHGAKVTDKDNYEKTPFNYAQSEEMLRVLSKKPLNWYFIIIAVGVFGMIICLLLIIFLLIKRVPLSKK